MDAATLQNRIYKGYGKAAQRIGPLYTQYRPGGSQNPLAAPYANLNASFNAEDMKYGRPNKYGKPTWYGIFDGSETQAGDYLVAVDGGGPFFIAAQQLALPILCVECNRRVRIARMPIQDGAGLAGYSGVVESSETDVLGQSDGAGNMVHGWPASILIGGRSDRDAHLPSSVKSAGWVVLLPPSVPISITESDVIIDDLGRRYPVYAAELTDLGWRLQVNEEHT